MMNRINPETVRPHGDLVLVRAKPADKTYKGLLVIPDKSQRQSGCQGYVVAVGPMISDLKRGDEVCYSSFDPDGAAPRLEDDEGTHYYFIKYDKINAVVEP
jgi:co-chaperonin GroES (HSP10)